MLTTMEICGATSKGVGVPTPPYRVNIWGLRKPETNKEGRQMVEQQVRNILRHLKEVHGIKKHLVTDMKDHVTTHWRLSKVNLYLQL